jgi:hypothetical protein
MRASVNCQEIGRNKIIKGQCIRNTARKDKFQKKRKEVTFLNWFFSVVSVDEEYLSQNQLLVNLDQHNL